MKKQILPVILLCMILLAGCSCQHEWLEATCTDAKHCTKCDAAEGDALGHTWTEANCTTAKTCSRCGLTEGEAPGHSWLEATCTDAKTCSVCAATEGQPLAHTWEGEATLYTAFKRLEELGYIASYWGSSGAGARRRYYTITAAGRDACFRLLGEWRETKEIMDKLLETEGAL